MIKDEFKIGDFVINWGERYQNEEEYFNNWKENIKLFVEKLSDIIPVENIILNRGRLSENYY
ncbi:teichoic acid biosynthesis protein, partial [Staphylococcus saprophyticus]|nr:teichoic acid biosynthesis protein [Staphylococcus saprophyticus]